MFYQRYEVVIVDLTCVFLDFRIIGGNSCLTQMCLVLGNVPVPCSSYNNTTFRCWDLTFQSQSQIVLNVTVAFFTFNTNETLLKYIRYFHSEQPLNCFNLSVYIVIVVIAKTYQEHVPRAGNLLTTASTELWTMPIFPSCTYTGRFGSSGSLKSVTNSNRMWLNRFWLLFGE